MGRLESRAAEEERVAREYDEQKIEESEKALRAASQIVPASGRLFVRAELATNPSSHLHIDPSARNMSLMGVIVTAGAGTTFTAGQRIIVGAFTGVKFMVNNVPHLICKEDEIQGVIVGSEVQALAQEA